MRSVRSQADDLQPHYSKLAMISCPPEEDVTRQEFRDDSDISSILRRYGVLPQGRGEPRFGEVDTDLDLTSAYAAMADAREAYADLPAEVREAFTFEELAAADFEQLTPKELAAQRAASLKAEEEADKKSDSGAASAPAGVPAPEAKG